MPENVETRRSTRKGEGMEEEKKSVEILGHDELIEKMQAFGHLSNKGGICYGFAMAAAEALLLTFSGLDPGALDRFYQRLALIQAIPKEAFEKKLLQGPQELDISSLRPEVLALLKAHPLMQSIPLENWSADRVSTPVDTWNAIRTEIHAFFDKVDLLFQAEKYAETYPDLFGGCDLHLLPVWPAMPDKPAGNVIPLTYPCYVYSKKAVSDEKKEEEGAYDAITTGLFYVDAEGRSTAVPIAPDSYSQKLINACIDKPYRRLNTEEAKQFGNFFQEPTPKTQGLGAALLTRSEITKEIGGQLTQTDSFTGVYTKNELEACLASLAQHATTSVVLTLSNTGHIITLAYDYKEKKWLLMEAEKSTGRSVEGYQYEEIAKEIRSSLPGGEFSMLRINAIALGVEKPSAGLAAWKEHLHATGLLTVNRTKASLVDSHGRSWLLLAAKNGDLATVDALLKNGADPNQALKDTYFSYDGFTPLHIAAQEGHVAVVEALLKRGAHLHFKVLQTTTPLEIAVRRGHEKIVQLIERYIEKQKALFDAVENGDRDALATYLATDANWAVKQMDAQGKTLLYLAAEKGDITTVKNLFAHGAAIDHTDADYRTPLYIAAQNGHTAVVQALLEEGANIHKMRLAVSRLHINKKEADARFNGHPDAVYDNITELFRIHEEKQKALFDAAKKGQIEPIVAELARNAPALLRQVNTDNNTLLHIAAQHGRIEIVDALLHAGADINQGGNRHATPLFLAVAHHQEAVVERLLARNAPVDKANARGMTPLHIAAEHGYIRILDRLLATEADIHKTNESGQTLLYLAAESGQEATVQYLLEKGIAIDQADQYGNTPLLAAAQEGQIAVVALLVKHHAAIHQAGAGKITPLLAAVQSGHTEIVSILLEAQADVHATREDGKTALHIAAEAGQAEIVTLLLAHDTAIDLADGNGVTPLVAAVQAGHTAVVHALWEAGADIHTAGADGKTPLDIAKENKQEDMQQWFAKCVLIDQLDAYIKKEGGKKPDRLAFLPYPPEQYLAEAKTLLLALREEKVDLNHLPSDVMQTLAADADKGGVLGKIYQAACTLSQPVEGAASPKIR